MKKIFLIFILAICCGNIFAQFSKDIERSKIIQTDCDDMIFTKVEILPSLKVSKESFEDYLTNALISKNAFVDDEGQTYKLFITRKSQILEIRRMAGQLTGSSIIEKAIVHYPAAWKPALQNGREVCAYVIMEVNIDNNKLHVVIRPLGPREFF